MKYSIKEIEKLTGIKAHTIRIWEKRYDLIIPHRTSTNIRYYSDEQLKEFLNISLLLTKGYRISEIAKLNKEEIVEASKVVYDEDEDKLSQLHSQDDINGLVVAMLELSKTKFEKVFTTSLIKRGFKDTLLNVVCPFMDKLKKLWQTNDITKGHQNFMLGLLKQKLQIALDNFIDNGFESEKYLFFLPKYEYTENGILMAKFIIKDRHKHSLYLGNNINESSLQPISESYKPDVYVTYLNSTKAANELKRILTKNSELFDKKRLIILGDQALISPLEKLADIKRFSNIRELEKYMQSL